MRKILAVIFIFASSLLFADDVVISPENVYIGDNVSVKIKCDDIGNIKEIDNKSFEIINKIKDNESLSLVLIPFDSGKYEFKSDCRDRKITFSFMVSGRIKDNISEIADIKNIEQIEVKPEYTIYLIIFLGAASISIILIYFYFKRKKRVKAVKEPYFAERFSALEKYKNDSKVYLEQLVFLYKFILGRIHNTDLIGKTTDEIEEIAKSNDINISLDILKEADLIKFSGKNPENELINKLENEIKLIIEETGEKDV